MKKMKNEYGLEIEVFYNSNEEFDVQLGGDSSNPSWQEYLDYFKEEYKPHVLLIKKCIEENGFLGYTGQDAQDLSFKFSDGQHWGYSWRAWGDLMSAIMDKKEGYIKYYM